MQQHIDQANHNQGFHDCIGTEFPDDFYDWRITVLFYTALHYMKALAAVRKIDIGRTHHEVNKYVNPKSPECKMQIKDHAWKSYYSLKKHSETARYDGIANPKAFNEIMKSYHIICLQDLNDFKNYVTKQLPPLEIAK